MSSEEVTGVQLVVSSMPRLNEPASRLLRLLRPTGIKTLAALPRQVVGFVLSSGRLHPSGVPLNLLPLPNTMKNSRPSTVTC